MNRSERMKANRDYQEWAGTQLFGSNWRSTTDEIFQIIRRCAEEECNGNFHEAWEKCYTRFTWSN